MALVLVSSVLFTVQGLKSQPVFYVEDTPLSADAGYKRSVLNCETLDVAFVEATTYFNPQLGWKFSTKLEYGKNYFSFSPLALANLPFWIYSSTH